MWIEESERKPELDKVIDHSDEKEKISSTVIFEDGWKRKGVAYYSEHRYWYCPLIEDVVHPIRWYEDKGLDLEK